MIKLDLCFIFGVILNNTKIWNNIHSISMQRKKKNITEMNYKKWLQLMLEKRILPQDSNRITALIKMR